LETEAEVEAQLQEYASALQGIDEVSILGHK